MSNKVFFYNHGNLNKSEILSGNFFKQNPQRRKALNNHTDFSSVKHSTHLRF